MARTATPTFEQYYEGVFGRRWSGLRSALGTETPQVNLRSFFPHLAGDYWLDPASYILARQLALVVRNTMDAAAQKTLRVWDMCAAPGGKFLTLALSLPPGSKLLGTELSAARLQRLRQQWALLPGQEHIHVQQGNACNLAQYYREIGRDFNAVLLDAPCSSERHLLKKPQLLAQWGPSRSRRNAQKQLAILCSALDCLASEGFLLYLTCALSPLENARVVARALVKRPQLQVVHLPISGLGEEWVLEPLPGNPEFACGLPPWGAYILPDRNNGCGPLYCCLLQRR